MGVEDASFHGFVNDLERTYNRLRVNDGSLWNLLWCKVYMLLPNQANFKNIRAIFKLCQLGKIYALSLELHLGTFYQFVPKVLSGNNIMTDGLSILKYLNELSIYELNFDSYVSEDKIRAFGHFSICNQNINHGRIQVGAGSPDPHLGNHKCLYVSWERLVWREFCTVLCEIYALMTETKSRPLPHPTPDGIFWIRTCNWLETAWSSVSLLALRRSFLVKDW